MNNKELLIKQWLLKAEHDLGTAKITFTHLPEYYDTIAFHCQQAVEKYLKAILVYNEIEFIKTHNLVYLISMLEGKLKLGDDLINEAIVLNTYSVQIRYPNEIIELTKQELMNAIATAEAFRIIAEEVLLTNNLTTQLDT